MHPNFVWGHMQVCAGAHGGQSCWLPLQTWAVVNFLMWVVDTELKPSARAYVFLTVKPSFQLPHYFNSSWDKIKLGRERERFKSQLATTESKTWALIMVQILMVMSGS